MLYYTRQLSSAQDLRILTSNACESIPNAEPSPFHVSLSQNQKTVPQMRFSPGVSRSYALDATECLVTPSANQKPPISTAPFKARLDF